MQPQANPVLNLVPIAAIFLIFYILIIRPQQRQQKEHESMLKALKKGDRILTSGGLYGTIVGLRGDSDLEVRFSDTVKLIVARSAVTKLVAAGSGDGEPAPAAKNA